MRKKQNLGALENVLETCRESKGSFRALRAVSFLAFVGKNLLYC